MTKKGAKLAGQTKFDLAEYLNNEETGDLNLQSVFLTDNWLLP